MERIGTFCDKCRQVMCICKSNPIPEYVEFYYKRTQNRYCGKLIVISFLKVLADGSVHCIYTTRMETSYMKTFGGIPMTLERVTKKEWIEASIELKKFYNI